MVFSVLVSRDFGKTQNMKESRGLVNGESRYDNVEYEDIGVDYDGSDSDDDPYGVSGKIPEDLTFNDVLRNTYRFATPPSSGGVEEILS
jgi:hypothetical protein